MKTSMIRFLCAVVFILPFSSASADEFPVDDYGFTWTVHKDGDIRIKVEKDPEGVQFILSGLGGKVATTYIEPNQAAALGEILVKSEEHLAVHRQYFEDQRNANSYKYKNEYSDKVKLARHEVTFQSSPMGEKFQVKVKRLGQIFATTVMNKDEAVRAGQVLLKADAIIAFMNKRVQF